MLLLLYLMFSVVIPQLIDSVVMLINNAETYYNKIYGWITNLLDKNPKVEDWVNENLETYYQNLLDLLTNKVLPGAQVVMAQPISDRVDEMVTGVRSDVAVKVFGDDLDLLKKKADEMAKAAAKAQRMIAETEKRHSKRNAR